MSDKITSGGVGETVAITGVRTQEIIACKDIPYKFTDKQSGKDVSGETRKICFVEYVDGQLSGMYICKAVAGFNPPLRQIGVLGWDRFGKAASFSKA